MNYQIRIQTSKPFKRPIEDPGQFVTGRSDYFSGQCACQECGTLQVISYLERCSWCYKPLRFSVRIQKDFLFFYKSFADFSIPVLRQARDAVKIGGYNPEDLAELEIISRMKAIEKLIKQKTAWEKANSRAAGIDVSYSGAAAGQPNILTPKGGQSGIDQVAGDPNKTTK